MMDMILEEVRAQIAQAQDSETQQAHNFDWSEIQTIPAPANNAQKIGLCRGRHEIPGVRRYVFGAEVNPLDPATLEREAAQYFRSFSGMRLQETGGILLYVTGLTVALIAALNACRNLSIPVTLMHFDRESGSYYPQQVA